MDPSPLQRAELFSNFPEEDWEFIVSRSSVVQLRRGAQLFASGEKAARFYVLLDGLIRVYRHREDGKDEMACFAPGDIIGDFDFARGASYDAYAQAAEDAVLIMFPGYGLCMESLAEENPSLYTRILLNAILMMTGRIKSTQRLIVENFAWVQEICRRAYEDPGTGLWKQSFLTDEIGRMLSPPATFILCKPDRFKILVDSRGHGVGDEAMIRLAKILKNIARRRGKGWAFRFKSNETGLLFNDCGAEQAEKIAAELHNAIATMKPVPAAGESPPFSFSASVVWAVWPEDNNSWETLFAESYDFLLGVWRDGGNRVVRHGGLS